MKTRNSLTIMNYPLNIFHTYILWVNINRWCYHVIKWIQRWKSMLKHLGYDKSQLEMVESLQVLLRYHTKALLNTVCVQLALNTVSNYFSWHPKRQRSRRGSKGGGGVTKETQHWTNPWIRTHIPWWWSCFSWSTSIRDTVSKWQWKNSLFIPNFLMPVII